MKFARRGPRHGGAPHLFRGSRGTFHNSPGFPNHLLRNPCFLHTPAFPCFCRGLALIVVLLACFVWRISVRARLMKRAIDQVVEITLNSGPSFAARVVLGNFRVFFCYFSVFFANLGNFLVFFGHFFKSDRGHFFKIWRFRAISGKI